MNGIDRRSCLGRLAAGGLAAAGGTLCGPDPVEAAGESSGEIVNGAEHAWLINDKDFPINPKLSNCPNSKPRRNYSMEHLLAEMQVHQVGGRF